jgi:hypothetical protein
MKVLGYHCCIFFVILFSCTDSKSEQNAIQNQSVDVQNLLVIGSDDQPFEYQLGDPISVVTDSIGNIFIADRASLTIKVFDPDGNYVRSIGGRGRGPGEFMQFNLMRPANDGSLLLQDRGKLEFIYLSKYGEQVSSHPVYISNQYYPKDVIWHDEFTIGLQQNGSGRTSNPPPMNRSLFYIYDKPFQNLDTSFFEFQELGYTEEEMFIFSSFIYHPGSVDALTGQNRFIFSPGVYTRQLYEFILTDSDGWQLGRTITGTPPTGLSYEIYSSESEYERMNGISGVNQIRFSSIPDWGRLYSIDAGVFYLNNGNIVHFYGEWRGGDTTLEEGNTFDLFVQVLSSEGEVLNHGFVKSLDIDRRPSLSLVSWKDEQDQFYLINLSKFEAPTVIKFRLDI